MRRLLAFALPMVALLGGALAAPVRAQTLPPPAEREVDYVRDVAPILQRCARCHGERRQRKSLRLDSRGAILAGGRSGPAVVAGESAGSLLVQHVTATAGKKRMPPKGDLLTPEQIGILRAWIDQGADGPEDEVVDEAGVGAGRHWAYTPVVRPATPDVERADWPRSDLDRFVLAGLEGEGLRPSPPADRAVWLRRVSLDLTGLPPTTSEVDAFENDREPDAFERVVDRLLASPRYGERWAQMWLDLARYADTKGYEKDARRSIWRYRDWVIDAFNGDMPFDRFTEEQLAGDLLPEPSVEQLIATAFHRNTMTNDEGGTDDEEFRVEAVADRVETTMQVWMGTTIGCVRCHDHKYDPFSQREYYQLFAFFDNTEDSDKPDDRPRIQTFSPEQEEQREKLLVERDRVQATLDNAATDHAPAREAWERRVVEQLAAFRKEPPVLGPWSTRGPFTAESADAALKAEFEPEKVAGDLDWTPRPGWRDGLVHNVFEESTAAHYLRRTIKTKRERTLHLSLGSDDSIAVWVNGEEVLRRRVSRGAAADQERIAVVLRPGTNDLLMKIVNGGGRSGFYFQTRPTDLPTRLVVLLDKDPAGRTEAERKELDDAFRDRAPELAAVRGEITDLQKKIDEIYAPMVPILRELPADKRRTTHIHERGSFLSPGEEVDPAVPAVFPPLPDDAPRNRLGLARWLTSPRNPLCARVVVNRFWEQLFGRGLVETSEDFGTQGEPPSHPLLLDWLASEFTEGGYGVKALLRSIVLSATYRQSSVLGPGAHDADPNNRWLARGPRFRLPAETIRDQALALGGLLSDKIHGPSVMPPQPAGLWQVVYSGDQWTTSEGDDRLRRGLYTFWRRTNPYPSMVTFDAPSREYCVLRRTRTNTPLQALVTLNDPVYVEAARALARRMIDQGGPDEARAAFGLRACVAREPRPAEVARLVALYRDVVARSEDSGDAELSAWTAVASVLLNLDEMLTKG